MITEYEVIYTDQELLHQWRVVKDVQYRKKVAKKLKGALVRKTYDDEGVCISSVVMVDHR